MSDSLYLYFDGLEYPLQLTECEYLTNYFSVLFPEWAYQVGQHNDNPIISIRFERDAYYLTTSWDEEVKRYTDKVDILCALIAALALANSFTDLNALHLHAASVIINDRLVVFPSQYRAGKSFLTACLVAEGHLYSGDDVLPICLDNFKGRAAGFAPRLRLPLPTTTDKKSKSFIESHTAIQGKRYSYLGLGDECKVARNDLFDIGAFVLLERENGIDAQLEELPVATIFQQLVKQNFAREVDGSRVLLALTEAVSNAQCIKLRYDRADDAVKLLTEHFSSWPCQQVHFPSELDTSHLNDKTTRTVEEDCFAQNQQVQKIRIEGESFLASPDGKAIYHLNQIGSGIWELLSLPTSKELIISTLIIAFPQVEKSTIEHDVTQILTALQFKGLVVSGDFQ